MFSRIVFVRERLRVSEATKDFITGKMPLERRERERKSERKDPGSSGTPTHFSRYY